MLAGFIVQITFFPDELSAQIGLFTGENTLEMPEERMIPEIEGTAGETVVTHSQGRLESISEAASQDVVYIETDKITAVLDSEGGVIRSYTLKDHLEDGNPVEMIFSGETGHGSGNVRIAGELLDGNYYMRQIDDRTVEFYQDLSHEVYGEFRFKKRYVFSEDEYIYLLSTEIEYLEGSTSQVPIPYSVEFGPQIGPAFEEELDGRYEFRKLYTMSLDKRDEVKLDRGETESVNDVKWAAIAGKYFTAITIPTDSSQRMELSEIAYDGIPQGSQITIDNGNSLYNEYFFYVGPLQNSELQRYDTASENEFGLMNMHLEELTSRTSVLRYLEYVLRWVLNFIYSVIPNYGIAIIILTLIIKLGLHPITKRSTRSTAAMAALSPKMEELREKYKDQPDKLNEAMAALYREEKINPLGGCLPMLIQFPIFISLYGLLNNHFDLRGAMFIPGWITDLSMPESIFTLPMSLPVIGDQIRLLPIIYVASMIFSMRSGPSAAGGDGQGAMNQKMMVYMMPIMFFFMLYNVPSGLLVYWIVMNLFTIIQQQYEKRKIRIAE